MKTKTMSHLAFTDNFNPDEYFTKLDAKSYMNHSKEHLDFLHDMLEKNNGVINFSKKKLTLKKMPAFTPLSTLNKNELECFIKFDDEISIPVLEEGQTVWMSHTPMEVSTCQKGIDLANGSVLMGGLGLGYMANRVLKKENVEKLTIYEIDEDLINSIGAELKSIYKEKLEIINDSIYNAPSSFDTVLVDIYKTYTSALDDEEIIKTFPDFLKNTKKYWYWGYQTEKGLCANAYESLLDGSRTLWFYEDFIEQTQLSLDFFLTLLDDVIFQCSCCGHYYKTSEKEIDEHGELYCEDCYETEVA